MLHYRQLLLVFTVGTIPDVSNTEGYTPLYITPKLKYVEGVSGQISSSKNSSYYTANQGKVQINPKNKNLFDKARAKLVAMGLKKNRLTLLLVNL